MEKTTLDRGRAIRAFLVTEGLHQPWLVNQLTRRGFRVDRSELSAALTGRRAFPKSLRIIDGCEEVINEYRQAYCNDVKTVN